MISRRIIPRISRPPLSSYLQNTPQTLPVHLIIPSLPGFGFSGPPPLHDRFNSLDVAGLWDGLTVGLGFDRYAAQGGYIGSRVTRLLGQHFAGCRGELSPLGSAILFKRRLAIHVNRFHMSLPSDLDVSTFDETDKAFVEKANSWEEAGTGYKLGQSTKPATVAMVVGSDPVALLA